MKLLDGFPDHPTLSASQVKAWRGCPRAWGFDKIDRVPRVSSPPQELGTAVHTILEEWLISGTPPNESVMLHGKFPGRIASAGLHLLPAPPIPVDRVESKFWLEIEPGIVFYGLIDLWTEDGDVWDHKTSSNPRYNLTPETLTEDVQAQIYAAVALTANPGRAVATNWIYYSTSGKPAAKLVTASWDTVDLSAIVETARQILHAREHCTRALDLPTNPRHCSKYGGCQYNELCTISTKERFIGQMTNENKENPPMDLAAFLAQNGVQAQAPAKKRGAAPPVPEAPPVPPVAPVPEAVPAPPVPEATPAPAPAPASAPDDRTHWTRDQAKAHGIKIGAFDASCRCGLPKLLDLIDEYEATIGVTHSDVAAHLAAPPLPPAPTPPAEVVISGTDQNGNPVSEVVPVPGVSAEAYSTVGTAPATYTTEPDIPTLYVDCVPYGSEDFTHLSRLVAEAKDQLGYDMDYRIEDENAFGKAAGRLSDAVASLIVPGDNVLASSRLAEHRDCLAMLEGRAGQVVKGV